MRAYLGRMYQVDVLEMTTEELLQNFREIALPGTVYASCGEFFPHADLVKFAKYVPARERAQQDLNSAHDMVEQVRADFARRQAAAVGAAAPPTVREEVAA